MTLTYQTERCVSLQQSAIVEDGHQGQWHTEDSDAHADDVEIDDEVVVEVVTQKTNTEYGGGREGVGTQRHDDDDGETDGGDDGGQETVFHVMMIGSHCRERHRIR